MSAERVAEPGQDTGSIVAKVVAFLLLGAFILGVGFWVGGRQRAAHEAGGLPPLTMVSPQQGARVSGPVVLVFETPARLVKAPEGWRAGSLHLHAVVDGMELMPAAADLRSLGPRRYEWTLPPVAAGRHVVSLRWSGPDHRPIRESTTPAVEIETAAGGAVRTGAPAGAHGGAHPQP